MRTRRKQNGYTLIELLIVMVIVAILSTISLTTYANLQDDSKHASTQGVAGSLASASVANFMLRSAGRANASTQAIANCVDVANLLTPGSLTSFTIAAQPIASGATATCTVDHVKPGSGTAATFTAYGIS